MLKPIVLSGLTTATGFGSLMLAQNVALSGLGTICAIGVAWCLLASVLDRNARHRGDATAAIDCTPPGDLHARSYS